MSGDEKLIGGYFYHTKSKTEKIEMMVNNESYETLCSNPKYGEPDEQTSDLKGKTVEVKIDGKEYKAIIQ